jgi:hypothetical protein
MLWQIIRRGTIDVMAELTGYSFSPGMQRRFTNAIAGQSALSPSQSQALQILSLKLPGFLGGTQLAPDALLRKPVGGSRPDLAVRAQLSGQMAPSPAPSAPSDTPPSTGQPSNPSDVFSRMTASSDRGQSQSNLLNPFQAITDVGGQQTTTPGNPMISFGTPGRPDAGTGTPTPLDLNGLMQSLFGGGNSGGNFGNDSGQNNFI